MHLKFCTKLVKLLIITSSLSFSLVSAHETNSSDYHTVIEEENLAEQEFLATQTLTFNYTLNVTIGLGGIVTPFVADPSGKVTMGVPVSITGIGTQTLTPISISNPLFGSYTVGIQTEGGSIGLGTSLTTTVEASRNLSTTFITNNKIILSILGSKSQTSAPFVFAPSFP
jgi:hypothetical protein